jgi:hypothetical protein
MTKARTVKETIVAKAKRLVAEMIGDQKLEEEGKAQERQARNQSDEAGETKPFGNLDRLT